MLHCEKDLIFGWGGLTVFPSNLDSAPEAASSIVIFVTLDKYIPSSNHFPSGHLIRSSAARLPSSKHLKEKEEWVVRMSLHMWSVIMVSTLSGSRSWSRHSEVEPNTIATCSLTFDAFRVGYMHLLPVLISSSFNGFCVRMLCDYLDLTKEFLFIQDGR